MALLTGRRRDGQRGSGTAIGVAIIFPMLMLVIVALRMLSDSARTEQAIQAAADRAAHTAALCCHYAGGPGGAEEVARASLRAAVNANAPNRIDCDNDLAGDSTVVFVDVNDHVVTLGRTLLGTYYPVHPPPPVPPGGTVYVTVTCRIPPQILGGYGFLAPDVERGALGVASIDPFRTRSGA